MSTIFKSLFVVVAVAAVAGGATWAYFTDTETSTGNTFATGTIDISVDSEKPWESKGQYMFPNMEPSDERNIDVTLKNVGTNPVVIWKKISVTEEKDVTESEPECDAEEGVWSGSDCSNQKSPKNDLSTQFVYEMKIGGKINIDRKWDVRVSDVNDLWVPIGRLDSKKEVEVDQNYYFNEKAENEYQGDSMTLDITFYAEQLNAPGPQHTKRGVVLENKSTDTGEWEPIVGDGRWGILTWDKSGNYTARAWGLANGTYQLAHYLEPSGPQNLFGSSVVSTSGNEITITGPISQLATYSNAKYWLRETTSWKNSDSLWESNLVDRL